MIDGLFKWVMLFVIRTTMLFVFDTIDNALLRIRNLQAATVSQ